MNKVRICRFVGERLAWPGGYTTQIGVSRDAYCFVCHVLIPRMTACIGIFHPKHREDGDDLTGQACLSCEVPPAALAPRPDPHPPKCEGEGLRGKRCSKPGTVGVRFAWGCATYCPKCADAECGPETTQAGAP
jgi:hypothetical protein